uniref:Uncharacterized protein n=1 Tax=viral metagenome TaxID=1070528 RepID=A0A6H1ZHS8_9ZZZZ
MRTVKCPYCGYDMIAMFFQCEDESGFTFGYGCCCNSIFKKEKKRQRKYLKSKRKEE